MKNILKSLIGVTLISLGLVSCSNSAPAKRKNGLELLYFGREKVAEPTEGHALREDGPTYLFDDEDDDNNLHIRGNIQGDDKICLEAQVKNPNRYSFIDVVLYIEAEGTYYAFTQGGINNAMTTTKYQDDMWVTDILIFVNGPLVQHPHEETGPCYIETYVEIGEITFLDLTGETAKPNIADFNKKRINMTVESLYPHEWGEWETVIEPTTSEYGIAVRECTVCHITEETWIAPIEPEDE